MQARSYRSVAETAPPPQRPRLRLVFELPRALGLLAPGRHQAKPNGPVLVVDKDGIVTVTGTSRMEMFDYVRRFLTPLARNRPPMQIPAVLYTPPDYYPGGSGCDSWTIILNADVAFTSGLTVELAPQLPAPTRSASSVDSA